MFNVVQIYRISFYTIFITLGVEEILCLGVDVGVGGILWMGEGGILWIGVGIWVGGILWMIIQVGVGIILWMEVEVGVEGILWKGLGVGGILFMYVKLSMRSNKFIILEMKLVKNLAIFCKLIFMMIDDCFANQKVYFNIMHSYYLWLLFMWNNSIIKNN